MKFRIVAVQVFLASITILMLAYALIHSSFAQSDSNSSNTLTNNTSVSSESYVLEGTSDDGAFKVMVNWKPNNITKENTFDLVFIDSKSGVEIENITYDIMLFKDDQHIAESHRSVQTAKEQKFIFADQGSYTLRIENINNTGASIELPLQVIP